MATSNAVSHGECGMIAIRKCTERFVTDDPEAGGSEERRAENGRRREEKGQCCGNNVSVLSEMMVCDSERDPEAQGQGENEKGRCQRRSCSSCHGAGTTLQGRRG